MKRYAQFSLSSAVIAATGAAAVLAALLVVATAVSAPVRVNGLGADPLFDFNRLAAVIALMVTSVSLVVQSFSRRYLQDEPNAQVFFLAALVATASAVTLAASGGVWVFAGAWIVCGAALVAMVAHDMRAPVAQQAVRATIISEVVSGALLLAAAGIVAQAPGSAGFDQLAAVTAQLSAQQFAGVDLLTVCALLLAGAALARCAQLPLGGWLQSSLSAPTPVSAFMHAGLVNAGGLLMVLWAPLLGSSRAGMLVIYSVAALTLLVVTTAMIARPDVKGSLALSTRAQMAFMLLQCALGAYAAGMFHLVAHSMYKASLFLGSGGVIQEHARNLAASPAHFSSQRAFRKTNPFAQMLLAAAVPALFFAAAVAVIVPSLADRLGDLGLLAFGWATAAQTAWWWLRIRRPSALGAIYGFALLGAAIFAYIGLFAAFKQFIAPALPAPPTGVVPGWLVIPLFLLAAVSTFARWLHESGVAAEPSSSSALGGLYRRVYGSALALGYVNRAPRPLRPARIPQPEAGK